MPGVKYERCQTAGTERLNRRNLLILLPSPDRLFLPLDISKVPFDAKTLH